MKAIRIYIILSLFITLVGCSSNDFKPQFKQETITSQESILNKIELENLNHVDTKVFLKLAEQKLKDLEDYMNLLMDNDLESEFKTNINQQIQGLIYARDTSIEAQYNLSNWIQEQMNEKNRFEFSNVKLLKESVKKEQEELTFAIHLKIKKKRSKNQEAIFLFSVEQIEKTFGENTLQLQEVKLTGLEIIQ